MLEGAKGSVLQFGRNEEEATRNALNTHMAQHECGLAVAEPRKAMAAKAS